MSYKKTVVVILCLAFVFASIFPLTSLAETEGKNDKRTPSFSDVAEKYWARDAITWMLNNKIIEGYGDGTFKPDRTVNRVEFAKMMVLALKLDFIQPEVATFRDVKKGSSQFKYVESAKPYLTVYRTQNGDLNYHPSEAALREDMAVALVKALQLNSESVDENILDAFTDKDCISPKLKKYVAIAMKNAIMSGYNNAKGERVFAPQETLTRAQAAVLLYNAFKTSEEKIAFEEEKDTWDGTMDTIPEEESVQYPAQEVRAEIINKNAVVVRWNKAADKNFTYYKVVVSKNNAHPEYPADGYFKYITDIDKIYSELEAGDSYNGGDFGGKLKAGEYYYFSVTAVYGDKKVAGNAVRLKMPQK